MYAYQGITVRPELKKKRMQEVIQSKSDSANYTKGQKDKRTKGQEREKTGTEEKNKYWSLHSIPRI